MPVVFNPDGSTTTGVDPATIPNTVQSVPYVVRGTQEQTPKNPDLAVTRSRKVERDPTTGAILGRFATGTHPHLYKPGGVLYVPPGS
jgi:hypothetical protein